MGGKEDILAAWKKKIWREIISNPIGYSRKKGGWVKFHEREILSFEAS